MENLTVKFERVNRTLTGKIGERIADFQFEFSIPQQPTPSVVSFNIYEADTVGTPYCSGQYYANGQFSPTFANVSTADWSILGQIVTICQGILAELKPTTAG